MTLLNLLSRPSRPKAAPDIVDSALETVRRHLGMEVAYLREFVDGQSVFRAVSAPGLEALLTPATRIDDLPGVGGEAELRGVVTPSGGVEATRLRDR